MIQSNIPDVQAQWIIDRLEDAARHKDKIKILDLYEDAKEVDWESVTSYLNDDYDKLIDTCNDILYS